MIHFCIMQSSPLIMLDSIRKDALVSFLLERSALTDKQFDTILLARNEGGLRSKASSRDGRTVSQGAFVRTLRQGQNNIESCFYTLILLSYLGLISAEELQRLLGISTLISKMKDTSPDLEAISRLLEALENVAKSLSRRNKKPYTVI